MFYLFLILSFLIGLIVGSFLNVVVLRYNTGFSIFGGNSICLSCGKKIHWFHLIPLFSFLYLKGQCHYCKSKISIQYPLVELFAGLIFLSVSLVLKKFNLELVLYWAIWSLLLTILVYDMKHKIIPNGLVYVFILLSLVKLFFFPGFFILPDLLTGIIIFSFFALLWFLSKGKWMGFGDAKLSLGIGFLLGFVGAPSAIILGFWVGAIVSLFLILIRKFSPSFGLPQAIKSLTIKSEIPLAPFLIIGAMLVFFFKIDVFNLTAMLFV